MEYHYQSDHRRSYRHRGSTWHPILYSLIFNFNYQFSIIMGKAYCFYQNYREVRLLVIHCSATRYDGIFPWRHSVHRTRHGDSPISAIISISHGTGNYTAAGRSTRSGRTQPDGTTKVSVYVTREDSTNKAVQLILGPTLSGVP